MAMVGSAARQMKLKNMNVMGIMQPRSARAAFNASFWAASSSQERSERSPQMG